jgi:hypothetical protein
MVLVSGCVLGLHGTSAVASTSEQKQTARVVSVRKVLRTPYFVSRYPQIHYYMLYFALRVSDQTYCGEYETPVLDEIDDLVTCNDRDVDVVLNGKGQAVYVFYHLLPFPKPLIWAAAYCGYACKNGDGGNRPVVRGVFHPLSPLDQ